MPNNTCNCTGCPFCQQSWSGSSKNLTYIWNKRNRSPLMLENNNSDILLVFEAPGIDEWSKRKPICSNRTSSAGRKFCEALKQAGKTRTAYDITEAVLCFPGTSTRKEHHKRQDEVDLAAMICMQYLMQDILSKQYCKIVCFGKVAYASVMAIYHINKGTHAYYNASYIQNIIPLDHPSHSRTLIQDIKAHL